MALKGLLQQVEKFEIQAYKKPTDPRILSKTHIAFTGSPQKHPYDKKKIFLIADPLSKNTFYYEFNKDDIGYIEELPNLVDLDGETITEARIWVKKESVGIRCTPFLVEDIW
jgi:inorganic pyrophosphatase